MTALLVVFMVIAAVAAVVLLWAFRWAEKRAHADYVERLLLDAEYAIDEAGERQAVNDRAALLAEVGWMQ